MVVNNPNNWHWVDKNCIDWTRSYFSENLIGFGAKDEKNSIYIDKVSSVDGDVVVSQRKGKVMSLFDVSLILGFSGHVENENLVLGSITVPSVSYDSTEDELQFDINIFKETSSNSSASTFIKAKILPQLRKILIKFGTDLILNNSSDIQISADKVNSTFTKANQEASTKSTTASKTQEKSSAPAKVANVSATTATATSTTAAAGTTTVQNSKSSVPKYNTSSLYLEPSFNTTAEQLYITLLNNARIGAWSRSHPIMESEVATEGSTIGLFGGSVSCKILKLVPNEHIVQLWRLEDWKKDHYAELDIRLIQGAGETRMAVSFTGIPIGEEDRVRGNFEEYYIRAIKITFGFGAVL